MNANRAELESLRAQSRAAYSERVMFMKIGDWREVDWTPAPWKSASSAEVQTQVTLWFYCSTTQLYKAGCGGLSCTLSSPVFAKPTAGRDPNNPHLQAQAYSDEFKQIARARGMPTDGQRECQTFDTQAEADKSYRDNRARNSGFNQKFTDIAWAPSEQIITPSATTPSAPTTPTAAGRPSVETAPARGAFRASFDAVSPAFAKSLGLESTAGALVIEAQNNANADNGGLRSLDVVTEVGGQIVETPADLQAIVGRMRPGYKAQVRVWRNKAMRDVIVETDATPVSAAAPLNTTVPMPASGSQADTVLLGKAQAGDLTSILQLAQMLELAPVNRSQAGAWYQKAADAGSPQGMGGLGASYFNAVGSSQNEVLAEQWWRKGAATGDGRSMSGLSILYADGKGGLQKDLPLAQEWLLKAVATGNGRAMARLSTLYAAGGSGFVRDDAQAFSWMQKAAATGEPLSMSAIAGMYEVGHAGAPQNDLLALSWAQKAAALGEPRAMNRIGAYQSNGRAGLPQSAVLALTWFQNAADLGDEFGMLNLGNYYLQGRAVQQSDALALAWFRKAAAAGNKNAEAQVLLLQAKGVR